VKVEATLVDGRKVYSVQAFNQGISSYLERLPTVWVEGEVTELRRQQRWATVYLTLKDPASGACLAVQMPRGQFDALRLDLVDGERVHVYGRPELYAQRGDFHLRALTIERYGLGAHLAALERLKQKLAAEGLFAAERKRALPRIPSLIGLVTGNDAAAKRDVLTTISARFPPARVLVAETYVQGPKAATAIVEARTSAARSHSGVSCSWPTADTTGTGHAATARTTRSSLNAARSVAAPPPRPTITTSTPARAIICSACTIMRGALAPCTTASAIRIGVGQRRSTVRMMSFTAAPRALVTTPMRRGHDGKRRLRASANSPSAASFFFSSSSAAASAPRPAGSQKST